jgi:type II secretory pathway component PulJ
MSKDAQSPIDPSQLPNDVGTCHQIIQELSQTLNDAQRRIAQLEAQQQKLARRHFGPTSEKDHQPALFEDDPDQASEAEASDAADAAYCEPDTVNPDYS